MVPTSARWAVVVVIISYAPSVSGCLDEGQPGPRSSYRVHVFADPVDVAEASQVTSIASGGWAANHLRVPTSAWSRMGTLGQFEARIGARTKAPPPDDAAATLIFRVVESALVEPTIALGLEWDVVLFGSEPTDQEFVVAFVLEPPARPARVRVGVLDRDGALPVAEVDRGALAAGSGAILALYHEPADGTRAESRGTNFSDTRTWSPVAGVHTPGTLSVTARRALAAPGIHLSTLVMDARGPRLGSWEHRSEVDGNRTDSGGDIIDLPVAADPVYLRALRFGNVSDESFVLHANTPDVGSFVRYDGVSIDWSSVRLRFSFNDQVAGGEVESTWKRVPVSR